VFVGAGGIRVRFEAAQKAVLTRRESMLKASR
jgi:hypothetical protein